MEVTLKGLALVGIAFAYNGIMYVYDRVKPKPKKTLETDESEDA